jgi:hypothetical protein
MYRHSSPQRVDAMSDNYWDQAERDLISLHRAMGRESEGIRQALLFRMRMTKDWAEAEYKKHYDSLVFAQRMGITP